MPKSFKFTSMLIFLLSVLFIVSFFISKRNPIFSSFNPFGDDPYDAVGSFSIQLSFFTALLCLVRAFRPYNQRTFQSNQKILLIRGLIISILSVLITSFTDLLAMIRYHSIWIQLPEGQLLAFLVIGIVVLSILAIWLVTRLSEGKIFIPQNKLITILTSFVIYTLIFSTYPSNWRQNIIGEIFTVAIGLLFSFLLIWIIINSLFPLIPNVPFEDSLDDLSAIISWSKKKNNFFITMFSPYDKLLSIPIFQKFVIWLNPRRHKWNLAILFAILISIYLALTQTIGEGIIPGSKNFILIITIFFLFETGAALLGYSLFAEYLGIVRKEN